MHPLGPLGPQVSASDEILEMLDADRPTPPPTRPWVATNMVMSLDGAYSSGGTSGALSSPADHALFLAQRSLADVILVGASTVRAERYRRPVVGEQARRIRADRGQEPTPRIVITSRSLELPADTPLLEGDPPPPIMAHPRSSATSSAPEGVELLAVGDTGVDLAQLLETLRERGAGHLICEGGPGLLGQLAALGLIDEYLLTLSPTLVGGADVGLLGRSTTDEPSFELHRVLRAGDHLMLSYRRN